MQSRPPKKRGHRAGVWLSTHKPQEPSGSWLGSCGGGGGGLADAVLFFSLIVAWVFVVQSLRFFLGRNHAGCDWEKYQGKVYCQIYNDELRFFRTVGGTSRAVIKPASIARPLAEIEKLQTFYSQGYRVLFTFSDGQTIELFAVEDSVELSNFRQLINAAASSPTTRPRRTTHDMAAI